MLYSLNNGKLKLIGKSLPQSSRGGGTLPVFSWVLNPSPSPSLSQRVLGDENVSKVKENRSKHSGLREDSKNVIIRRDECINEGGTGLAGNFYLNANFRTNILFLSFCRVTILKAYSTKKL